MWVCPECKQENTTNNTTCVHCNSERPSQDVPKIRREHRHASYIKDKKTMYTHPGPYGWKLVENAAYGADSLPDNFRCVHQYRDDFKIIAVIDIGTCMSKVCYYPRTDTSKFRTDCLPTCLLISGDGKFQGFGNDVLFKLKELEKSGKPDDFYIFQQFKSDLFQHEKLSSDTMIEDITGKKLEAELVFSFTILALKKHVMAMMKSDGHQVMINDIRWVIPLPSVWNDSFKQFIRNLAELTGIQDDQLILSDEAESAALHSQMYHIRPGERYMSVSIGGGYTNILLNEKCADGSIAELISPRGGNFGIDDANRKFLQLFEHIVGKNVMGQFRTSHPSLFQDLLREFDRAKQNINSNDAGHVSINIPRDQLETISKQLTGKNLLSAIKSAGFTLVIQLHQNCISIENNLFRGLFKFPLEMTKTLMKEVFEDPASSNVSKVLLTGTAVHSAFIQDSIRSEFPHKTFLTPDDPSVAIGKGSLAYGNNRSLVKSRVMKYSYGVGISDDFDPNKYDDAHKMPLPNGSALAIHVFDVIVRKNTPVSQGTVYESEYLTLEKNQKSMEFELYYSTNENPTYVDEPGSKLLGSAVIEFSVTSVEDRSVKVLFIIEDNEIGMKAIDTNSGRNILEKFVLV